ncbi:Alpha/Beta hydrolase protein [Calycina marina]|uniref:triacylglycerol lipase n=1 Tax=Calycina marina TaxID=1763456 RepID=A0A9P8CGH2_9HELO|nr:Alpha/Beta hydrolase protein [Calycina marina]
MRCYSTGRVSAGLLLSFLTIMPPVAAQNIPEPLRVLNPFPLIPEHQAPSQSAHKFSLRHVLHHGIQDQTIYRRLDVEKPEMSMWIESEDGDLEQESRPLVAKTNSMKIQRLRDRRPSVVDPMVAAAREDGGYNIMSPSEWSIDDLAGPDITDKETVLTLAQMAANAYVDKPNTGDWKDVNGGFNRTDDHGFGWEDNGLRGYLYVDEMNTTLVIGLKGTNLAIWDGDGTTTNDKENDNLFFSCCCGQQGSSFARQVCDCAQDTYTCNISCLKKSLRKENRYYAAARHLYSNVTAMYPDHQIWMSGHSLGGSVSAMLGLTYGIPAVTFEAVPDALPANRLGLPIPPGTDPTRPGQRDYTGAYHFGINSDPIYLGSCNGATASCAYAGYALESACHTGRECVYDVVAVNGTRVSVITHRIIWVISNVIKKWATVPECKFTPECYDCPLWKEVTGNKSDATTMPSTSSRTKTRTTTCQTPGWWGCLDETTTTTTSSSSSMTSTTTSTCKTPGWFGCNDETTTTASVSSQPTLTVTSTSKSTTCTSPGFFGGCNDPTTTSPSSSRPTCETPGIFFGCNDKTTTSSFSHPITSPPSMPTMTTSSRTTATSTTCTSKEWFGLICVDPSPTPTSVPYKKPRCLKRSLWGLGWCVKWESVQIVFAEEL